MNLILTEVKILLLIDISNIELIQIRTIYTEMYTMPSLLIRGLVKWHIYTSEIYSGDSAIDSGD